MDEPIIKLTCEWDNYFNDGFDIYSINNGIIGRSDYISTLNKNYEDKIEFHIDNIQDFSFKEYSENFDLENDKVKEDNAENNRYDNDILNNIEIEDKENQFFSSSSSGNNHMNRDYKLYLSKTFVGNMFKNIDKRNSWRNIVDQVEEHHQENNIKNILNEDDNIHKTTEEFLSDEEEVRNLNNNNNTINRKIVNNFINCVLSKKYEMKDYLNCPRGEYQSKINKTENNTELLTITETNIEKNSPKKNLTIPPEIVNIINNTSNNNNINEILLKNKEIEIKNLNEKLNTYKYQNKIILDENKKLLEIINIFKVLQNLENKNSQITTNSSNNSLNTVHTSEALISKNIIKENNMPVEIDNNIAIHHQINNKEKDNINCTSKAMKRKEEKHINKLDANYGIQYINVNSNENNNQSDLQKSSNQMTNQNYKSPKEIDKDININKSTKNLYINTNKVKTTSYGAIQKNNNKIKEKDYVNRNINNKNDNNMSHNESNKLETKKTYIKINPVYSTNEHNKNSFNKNIKQQFNSNTTKENSRIQVNDNTNPVNSSNKALLSINAYNNYNNYSSQQNEISNNNDKINKLDCQDINDFSIKKVKSPDYDSNTGNNHRYTNEEFNYNHPKQQQEVLQYFNNQDSFQNSEKDGYLLNKNLTFEFNSSHNTNPSNNENYINSITNVSPDISNKFFYSDNHNNIEQDFDPNIFLNNQNKEEINFICNNYSNSSLNNDLLQRKSIQTNKPSLISSENSMFMNNSTYSEVIHILERYKEMNEKLIATLNVESNSTKIDLEKRRRDVDKLEEVLNYITSLSYNSEEKKDEHIPFHLIDKRKLYENIVNYMFGKKEKESPKYNNSSGNLTNSMGKKSSKSFKTHKTK